MRNDFCAFILSHGRPDHVVTLSTLKRAGYTGKVYIVIDDEDKTADKYKEKYGDIVIQFCKKDIAELTDEGDNFGHRKSTIYARNVFHDLAKERGYKYFIQLDDDYTSFFIRYNSKLEYVSARIKKTMDEVLETMLKFYISTPSVSIAMSQGGDHIGGGEDEGGKRYPAMRRKCMNSFICSVDRPLQFFGHLNEDVNTYVTRTFRGDLFFTIMQAQLNQIQTQANKGGMSDIYLAQGTYIKSLYTVMYAPSCVKVGLMGDPRNGNKPRIHHDINWGNCAPKIIREEYKK